MVASYFWYPTKLLGPVLPGFLFCIKENKTKQDKRGTPPHVHLATTENERKAVLQCII